VVVVVVGAKVVVVGAIVVVGDNVVVVVGAKVVVVGAIVVVVGAKVVVVVGHSAQQVVASYLVEVTLVKFLQYPLYDNVTFGKPAQTTAISFPQIEVNEQKSDELPVQKNELDGVAHTNPISPPSLQLTFLPILFHSNGSPKQSGHELLNIVCVTELSHLSLLFSNLIHPLIDGISTLAVEPTDGKKTGDEPVNNE
jgi:hypothetical protein